MAVEIIVATRLALPPHQGEWALKLECPQGGVELWAARDLECRIFLKELLPERSFDLVQPVS